MIKTLCPVCQKPLAQDGAQWRCENGHSFDVARQGYVNLLTVQQKHSLNPGDTREMVAARRRFLEQGHYTPIVEKLRELTDRYAPRMECALDVGCGEGYYLSRLNAAERWGLDISKEAARYAAGRDKSAHFLTATAAHLPFSDGSFDCLLSMFALTVEGEFARVLKPNGIFLQVLAGENHLPELKRLIYPTVLHKSKELHPHLEGFSLLHEETLRFSFRLSDAETVQDLLYMTPHVWRITKAAAEALAQTDCLSDTAEVVFNVYGRQPQGNLLK